MKVRAQIGMVLNLDKCIGCHTCSVTCKNVWTSRDGVEYAWFNNVETKPGIGYPKDWENQDRNSTLMRSDPARRASPEHDHELLERREAARDRQREGTSRSGLGKTGRDGGAVRRQGDRFPGRA